MPTIEISMQSYVRLGLYGSKNDSWDSIIQEIMDQVDPNHDELPEKDWSKFGN